jgi:HEPN domain-containing protein
MNGNRELMEEWFKKADHDLLNAEIILESGRESLPLDTVCFHCQQAVEKYFKGFLIYHNIEFPRTHFLGTLLEQCRQIDETFEELDEVIELSVYAVDVRYPDDTMEIDLEDAREAFEMATRVKLFVPEKVEEQREQIESAKEEWEEEDEAEE